MVDWLVWTAIDYGELFDRVVEAVWLSDGVTEQEIRVLKHLFFLATKDPGFALWLLGQPFLETVEYADGPAVESLVRVQFLAPEQANPVQALLLETGGVTDEWAPIVAMTWPVARFDPEELPRLYDPSVVRVHTKMVDLDESGPTLLAVVRTEPGAGETLPLVESIVRDVEGTMGRPLPLDYVGALFGDAVAPGAIGINYGTGMVLEPRFDVADGSYAAEKLRVVLTHEMAHYWWNSNENWIDEGMAEFLAAASYGFPTGHEYLFLRPPVRRQGHCPSCRPSAEIPFPATTRWDSACSSACTACWGRKAFTTPRENSTTRAKRTWATRACSGYPPAWKTSGMPSERREMQPSTVGSMVRATRTWMIFEEAESPGTRNPPRRRRC